MTISQSEVSQMANFMRALNPDASYDTGDTGDNVASSSTHASGTASSQDVREMKSILERFHAVADQTVQRLDEDSYNDSDLRAALVTERTDRGSRVGKWEIRQTGSGKQKFYDVIHLESKTSIAADLTLYEAAYGLVRILNDGGKLNSREAIKLLKAEQDYASALNEAVTYRHYLTKNARDVRKAVFEAKYSAAKQRAISARDIVSLIAERY